MITPTSKLSQHEIDGFNSRLAAVYSRYYRAGIDVSDAAAEVVAWAWLMTDWMGEFAKTVAEHEPTYQTAQDVARFRLWVAQQMTVYDAMEREYKRANARRDAYMLTPADDDTRELLRVVGQAAQRWEAEQAHG